MKQVILTYDSPGDVSVEQKIFGSSATIEKIPCTTEEDLVRVCADADAVITCYEPFNERVISQLPKLKTIACKSIGTNYVDLKAATKAGIVVTNIPEYCIHEVADHTVTFILAINRRIIPYNNSTHLDKQWNYKLCEGMKRFNKQKVGFLGMGRIPRLVAERLKGFGVEMIAYDPYVSQKDVDVINVTMKSFDEVISESDYISCHLPLLPETSKIINTETISQMKRGVVFINTSRGGVVDEDSLLQALKSRHISYCALDVLVEEHPNMEEHPFSYLEEVILTPHTAYFSEDSTLDAKIHSAQNVLHALNGDYEKCYVVNKEVLSSGGLK